jgi:hypothetical protein
MKKSLIAMCVSVLVFFAYDNAFAEWWKIWGKEEVRKTQKRVFDLDGFRAGSWNEDECRKYCGIFDENVDVYLNSGWHVVTSSQKEKVKADNCICIGMEYVIEK